MKVFTAPIQGTLEHACGLHTISIIRELLLGIRVYKQEARGGSLGEREFVTLGAEIVNLAIVGYMDSLTIQAFLNGHDDWVCSKPLQQSSRVMHMHTRTQRRGGKGAFSFMLVSSMTMHMRFAICGSSRRTGESFTMTTALSFYPE